MNLRQSLSQFALRHAALKAQFERINLNELYRTDDGGPIRVGNIPIGAVAFGSLGTSAVHVAGTIYVSEIFVPRTKRVTGIGILNGATVGTDNLLVALFGPNGGMPLMTSALAGVLSAGANAMQEIPFIRPLQLVNDGKYWIGLQCNGGTATTRRIAASTYLNLAKSYTGTFGAVTALTVPTTFTADTGPIGYLY
jgi:hypothetical protein